MFGVEIVATIVAGSVSLRADALDFLADAANYASPSLCRVWR
jgi:Co/Zn/Cd efflux system component